MDGTSIRKILPYDGFEIPGWSENSNQMYSFKLAESVLFYCFSSFK